MTAKEKALELINKFIDASIVEEEINYYHPKPYSLAKQCAIIAVDEILSVMNSLFTESYLDSLDENKYWQQVKEEIENL